MRSEIVERRHDDLLTTKLEEVYDNGVAFVAWTEIYRWYGTQKIAAGTLRNLSQRWDDLSKGKQGPLLRVRNNGGMFLTAKKFVEPVYVPPKD